MTDQWITKSLGDLVEFQRGLTYSKEDEVASSSNIVLRANNIDLASNLLDLTELRYISDKIGVPASKKLKRGALLICTASGSKSHLGKVALVDGEYDYAFGGFMGQLTPKPTIDSKYLFYFMISDAYKEHIRALSDGVNINNLRFDDLKLLGVPLPPLLEQQRTVAILDDVFAGLATATANTEKILKNARELFESYLNSVFATKGDDWEDCTLDQLVAIKHGFAFKSDYFTSKGEYVLLTPGNFFEEGGYRDRGDKQKYYVGEIPEGFILKKGDFLIAMTEQAAGLLGSSVIVPEDNRFLHNQRLGLVQLKPGTHWSNEFFFHAFNTKDFRRAAHDSASGVKVRHTSPTKLGEIAISFPRSRDEQDKIARQLDGLRDETERLTEKYELKLLQIAELRQSILQKALSGELTSPPEQAIKEAAE